MDPKKSKPKHICDAMTVAIPRCLCGATVANCITEKCHQALDGDPNAKIALEEWRRACLIESPYCQSERQKGEACSIQYDYNLIDRHNKGKGRVPLPF